MAVRSSLYLLANSLSYGEVLMYGDKSLKISLSIASDLLEQVDELAKRDYTSRSDLLRQALLDYVRKPGNDIYKVDKARQLKREFDKKELDRMRAKHPEVQPDDIELLKFLSEYEDGL